MKLLIVICLYMVSFSAIAATLTGELISEKIVKALGNQNRIKGDMVDGSRCEILVENQLGKSSGTVVLTISGDNEFPVTFSLAGNYEIATENHKDGYLLETMTVPFGGIKQVITLGTLPNNTMFINAESSFNGQSMSSGYCFAKP